MRKTYKYRVYLTNGQRRILNTMLEECRWVYNQMLEAHEFAYEHSLKCNRYDLINLLPGWKGSRPSLKLVHSQVLQNIAIRLDLAFCAFFRRVKAGEEEAGYPRYKKFDRYRSITYPQYGNGVTIRGNDLVVSKIGRIKLVWHRRVEGQIKTVSLKRSRTNKWYVTFSVEVEPQRLPASAQVVGVDMGLVSFLTTSNGEKVENPRFFRRDEADLKRVQKLKDAAKHAQKWDENRKRKKALARIHERIAWRREDFAHKRSRELVNSYQVIAFEELEPQQMGASKGRGMRKSIADVAWTQLIQYTCNKAEEAGRTVVLINPSNTSKMCSNPNCGRLVEKDLSVRVHDCPHCGLVLDRDQNAARNILRLGLQNLRL
jgi:putative transposase